MASITSSNEEGHVTITYGREGIGLNGRDVDTAKLSFEWGRPTWVDSIRSYFDNDSITNKVELSVARGTVLSGFSVDVAIDPNGVVDAAGNSINPSSTEVYVGTITGTASLLGLGGSTEV